MKNETINVDNLKKFLRIFCIAFDHMLSDLRSGNKFDQIAIAPRIGKIDPYDVNNFMCNLRWLKPSKMEEILRSLLPKVMWDMERSKISPNNSDMISAVFTKHMTGYAFDHIKSSRSNNKIAQTTLFTHFALTFKVDDIEDLNLAEDESEVLKEFREKCLVKRHVSEETIRKMCLNPILGRVLNRENLYTSIMDFTVCDYNLFMGVQMEYLLDWKGYFDVESRESFYKSIYFWENTLDSTERHSLDKFIPLEEVPLNLIDLNYRN